VSACATCRRSLSVLNDQLADDVMPMEPVGDEERPGLVGREFNRRQLAYFNVERLDAEDRVLPILIAADDDRRVRAIRGRIEESHLDSPLDREGSRVDLQIIQTMDQSELLHLLTLGLRHDDLPVHAGVDAARIVKDARGIEGELERLPRVECTGVKRTIAAGHGMGHGILVGPEDGRAGGHGDGARAESKILIGDCPHLALRWVNTQPTGDQNEVIDDLLTGS